MPLLPFKTKHVFFFLVHELGEPVGLYWGGLQGLYWGSRSAGTLEHILFLKQ
jgi:hypothetical protein